jgi:ABC-type transport system involved in multi-copper enzyme maturation permease subunit
MGNATQNMLGGLPATFNVAWLAHCGIMTVLSALMLALSAISVRRVGLRQATGQPGIFASRKERRAAKAKRKTERGSAPMSGRIICVKGPPIVWKEMRTMSVKVGRFMPVLSGVLVVLVLAATYGYCAYKGYLALEWVQAAFVLVYFLLGLLRAATSAAVSITSEKEARTWPVLLATALTDRQIVLGKILGSCLQSWAFWLLLTVHVVVFSLVGYISAAAILPLAVLVVASALLVSSIGVLFSSWCKRSSTSASANLLLLLGLVMPFCCPLPVYLVNPIFAALMILAFTGRWDIGAPFNRMGFGVQTSWLVTLSTSALALVVLVGLYLLLAFAASAAATWKVRRKIY